MPDEDELIGIPLEPDQDIAHLKELIFQDVAIETRIVQGYDITDALFNSWRRCRKSGLQPSDSVENRGESVSRGHRETESDGDKELRAVSKASLQEAADRFGNVQCAFLITNLEQDLIACVSNVADYQKKRFGLCRRLSERNCGTLSHIITLENGNATCLSGAEHYLETFAETLDVSAPILDGDGHVLGVLSLLVEQSVAHGENPILIRSTLDYVVALAEIISEKRMSHRAVQQLKLADELFLNVLSYIDDGLIVINNKGQIINSNRRGRLILDPSKHDLTGRSILDYTKKGSHLSNLILSGNTVNNLKMVVGTSDGERECVFSTRPITKPGNTFQGSIIRVREVQENDIDSMPVRGLNAQYTFDSMVGMDPTFEEAKHKARVFAPTLARVLLTGDIGSGKEYFAQAIHNEFNSDAPFIAVNCAALQEDFAQRELFGFESERRNVMGKLEQANEGTLFLDGIEGLSLNSQSLLLRAVDEKMIVRVNGIEAQAAQFRLISSSSENLEQLIEDGRFRGDLYYRISSAHIHIPPLAERGNDIILLAEHFISYYCESRSVPPIVCPSEVKTILRSYTWPGNVRQLQNCIRYACDLCRHSVITVDDLPEEVIASVKSAPSHRISASTRPLKEIEYQQIIGALQETDNNISQAAKLLGMGRSTLYKRLKQYKIEVK